MKDLFTIGEVASLFSVNIRTLRYYDEYGILKPEKTDPQSGYRYYSTKQFERLNTIKYLRALGMPLQKIAAFFANRDIQSLRRLLLMQQEETKIKIREMQRIANKLERRIGELDDALSGTLNLVLREFIPQRRAAFLKKEISLSEDLEYPIRELEQSCMLEPMMFLGKVGVSIGRQRLLSGQFDCFDGIFVLLEQEDEYSGPVRILPACDYVTVRFSGTHINAGGHYRKLLQYMQENNLTCAGDSVEVTLIDAGFTDDATRYVTRLQIPVEEAV